MKKEFPQIPVDNAGKIYPCIIRSNYSPQFRLCATMTEDINENALRSAVSALRERFPYIYAKLRIGKNWDMLEHTKVMPEIRYGIHPMFSDFNVFDNDAPLFRVLYEEKTIAIEIFHSITDGTGGMVYFKTLIAYYLDYCGHKTQKDNGALNAHDKVTKEEIEDSFQKLYNKKKCAKRASPTAYQAKFNDKRKDNTCVTKLSLDVTELKEMISKNYNCTVTQYLLAVYFNTFIKIQNKKKSLYKAPIVISAPINLRNVFESCTQRNFAMICNITLKNKKQPLTFDQILEKVIEEQQKGIDKDYLRSLVSRNLKDEKQWIAATTSMRLKRPIMKKAIDYYGEKKNTSQLSNLGYVKLPTGAENYVEELGFSINPQLLNSHICSVVATKNILNIIFSSKYDDRTLPEMFKNILEEDGLKVNAVIFD